MLISAFFVQQKRRLDKWISQVILWQSKKIKMNFFYLGELNKFYLFPSDVVKTTSGQLWKSPTVLASKKIGIPLLLFTN